MEELKIKKTSYSTIQIDTILYSAFEEEFNNFKKEYSKKESCNKSTLSFLAIRTNAMLDVLFLTNKISVDDWTKIGKEITKMRHTYK